jgi:hypothetical protein
MDIGYGNDDPLVHSPPLLFDVENDPGEARALLPSHYDHIITIIMTLAAAHISTISPVKDQLITRNNLFALCCNILTDCVCDIEPPPPSPPVPPYAHAHAYTTLSSSSSSSPLWSSSRSPSSYNRTLVNVDNH